mmetsp:Transcript_29963/g.95748  ORF Transcript_29963/g.95748 Transcript_29963/m.95748 type:complete len:299 (-) Transcript_29963:137-1033(-)
MRLGAPRLALVVAVACYCCGAASSAGMAAAQWGRRLPSSSTGRNTIICRTLALRSSSSRSSGGRGSGSVSSRGRSSCRGSSASDDAGGEGMLRLTREVRFEIEKVKGSRFIGYAAPANGEAAAEAVVAAERERYPDARHWCFASRLYLPGRAVAERAGDDGEPSGTAGRPILNALKGSGLVDACVVVTRYFGGTKLGTGGLVKSYGGAAQAVLKAAEEEGAVAPFVPMAALRLRFPHSVTGTVWGIVGATEGAAVADDSQEVGAAGTTMEVTLPAEAADGLAAELSERTAALCTVERA